MLEQLAPILLATPSSSATSSPRLPTLSSVLVTTPQAVSLSDVSKELDFARKTGLKVIGLIENMSGYLCPHCEEVQYVFGGGGGEAFCEKVSARATREVTDSTTDRLVFLGKVPIDVQFMKLMDQAMWTSPKTDNESPNQTTNANDPSNDNWDLVRRYAEVPSSKIFHDITHRIVRAIGEQPTIS